MNTDVNYIRDYFRAKEHDFGSVLTLNIDNDKEVVGLKRQVNKVARELEELKSDLRMAMSRLYSTKFVSISGKNYLIYRSRRYGVEDAFFDIDTGLAVDDTIMENEDIKIVEDTKTGEFSIVVGYDFELASIIVRRYKYSIVKDNSRVNLTLLEERVVPFLEEGRSCAVAKVVFGADGSGTLVEVNDTYDYRDVGALERVSGKQFINTLFGVNYEGEKTLDVLKKYYAKNKSFEIILKTSPKEIIDDLLSLDIESAMPIHKIIGVTIDTYNKAIEHNMIRLLCRHRNYIRGDYNASLGITKTESEWLDYIEEVNTYQDDFDFYNISMNGYDSLLDSILYSYKRHDVLRKYYSLGKFTNYVVVETINQGYTSLSNFIGELVDYLDMCDTDNIKPTLYSSYLKQTHDITSRNHKVIVAEENERIFKDRYKDFKEYKTENGYYVVVPKCSDDLKHEGDNLNHCVASYIKRVIDGECMIYFLRREKEESLITFEVRHDTIVQVRGLHNRKPTKSEVKALEEFAKNRKLEVRF